MRQFFRSFICAILSNYIRGCTRIPSETGHPCFHRPCDLSYLTYPGLRSTRLQTRKSFLAATPAQAVRRKEKFRVSVNGQGLRPSLAVQALLGIRPASCQRTISGTDFCIPIRTEIDIPIAALVYIVSPRRSAIVCRHREPLSTCTHPRRKPLPPTVTPSFVYASPPAPNTRAFYRSPTTVTFIPYKRPATTSKHALRRTCPVPCYQAPRSVLAPCLLKVRNLAPGAKS